MSIILNRKSQARTLVGYCWPTSVRAGDKLDFMVSGQKDNATYQADLVQIICAEDLTNPEMFKVEESHAPFAGSYAVHRQETHIGSYAEIESQPILDTLTSFTVQALVMPTLLSSGEHIRIGGAPLSAEKAVLQDQHLISRWDNVTKRGWALIIDESGRASFIAGDGKSIERSTVLEPLARDQWYLIVAGYDAEAREMKVSACHAANLVWPNIAWSEASHVHRCGQRFSMVQAGPLRFAACADGRGHKQKPKPAHCFNGRLDRVRLSVGLLSTHEARVRAVANTPDAFVSSVIGFWDFSKEMDSVYVHDLSVNKLRGTLVNIPTRALAGATWNGSSTDWRQNPGEFSAIHFHDDDLYDAEWSRDFSYEVPAELPSGIYAARLRLDDEAEYIPFFVAPPKGKVTADVALLIPTASYTAYTNMPTLTAFMKRKKREGGGAASQVVEEEIAIAIVQDGNHADFLMNNLRSLGKGIYANHTDGTLCTTSSQKHPNMMVKPNGLQWTLSADTLITDWLEKKKIKYDVITDDLLHREGANLLKPYKVVLTGNHPEYYSRAMLDAVLQYQGSGGRLMYLGGNGFFWVTSFHRQLPGAIEVRKNIYSGLCKPHELFHSFECIRGGLWDDNGRPPNAVVGVGYDPNTGSIWDDSSAYRRLPDSYNPRAEFIFAGVQSTVFGDFGILGKASGQEVDRVCKELGTPPHALHLARADDFPSHVTMFEKQYEDNAPHPFGDIVYFENPNGGATFSVGSMAWVGALSHDGYKNDVEKITANVLLRFLDPKPILAGG